MKLDQQPIFRALDRLPPLGDVDIALSQGRKLRQVRRTLNYTAASLVTAAAIVVTVSVVPRDGLLRESPSPVEDPTVSRPLEEDSLTKPVRIDEAIRAWVPKPDYLGAAAPVDTAIAHTCATRTDCQWLLLGGRHTLNLATVSPTLRDLITSVGFGDLSLSFDAQWMSIGFDNGLRVQPLAPDASSTPIVLESAAAETRWKLVAWGSGSLNASFVELDAFGSPRRYAYVDLLARHVEFAAQPKGQELGPIGHFGIGPLLGPRTVQIGHERSRVTTVETSVLPLVEDSGLPRGTVFAVSRDEVAPLVLPDETLAGANGLLEVRTPPSVNDEAVWPYVTVYRESNGGVQRSGVIELRRGAPRRLSYADSKEQRVFLGVIRPMQAVTVEDSDASTLSGQGKAGTLWSHRLSSNTRWIVPGLSSGVG